MPEPKVRRRKAAKEAKAARSAPAREPGVRREQPERPRRAQRTERPERTEGARRPERPRRPEGSSSRWSVAAIAALWTVLVVAGLAAVGTAWTPLRLPGALPLAGAVLVTTCYAFAVAVRSGGRPLLSALLALLLAGTAAVADLPVLLAGAAVGTAVLGAVLGMLATIPAVRFPQVVRECVVAALVVAGAAVAASGYDAQVSADRAGYLTLGLATASALALVYRLGAGLHGLGRRGSIMVATGVALLAVSLAYTAALARWGPPGLVGNIEQVTDRLRATLGAVPRPTEMLLGFPALAWAVSTRARRRQGWWAAVFGAAGLGVAAASLLDPTVPLLEAGLSLLYSLVIGLALGYLVIRADRFLSGARGRRARRAEEAAAHRPEPGRLQPLM